MTSRCAFVWSKKIRQIARWFEAAKMVPAETVSCDSTLFRRSSKKSDVSFELRLSRLCFFVLVHSISSQRFSVDVQASSSTEVATSQSAATSPRVLPIGSANGVLRPMSYEISLFSADDRLECPPSSLGSISS